MQIRWRDLVRAVLPMTALALCHGCGGGGDSGTTAQAGAPTPTPAAGNGAPTISVDSSAYARVGTHYEVQPAAADSDGDALTFTANNLPPWAAIDEKTGRISGTPMVGDVGAYEEITVTVADAGHRSVSKPFSITVLGAATGMASLHWDAPPSKVDGSPLDDLAGYRILFGRSQENLDQSIFLSGSTQTSYDVDGLEEGIWYFAIIAVNANGLEGPASTPMMKSI